MSDVKRLLDLIARGEKTIDALCSGKQRWVMNVPAEPDRDPDLVLSDALRAGREAVVAVDALATWIVQETDGKDRIWDHACRECTGPTRIVIDGFRCAVHRARGFVGGRAVLA